MAALHPDQLGYVCTATEIARLLAISPRKLARLKRAGLLPPPLWFDQHHWLTATVLRWIEHETSLHARRRVA